MPAPQLLGVYLNDHLAGATVGAELGHRMVLEHGDTAYGDELRNLATEIAQDRRALLRIMGEVEVPARRYKVYGAWLGEKLGRAKPNGRLLRRSALTLLIELEALRSGVAGKALLWRTLLTAAVDDARFDQDRLEELRQRADRRTQTLDSLHARAAAGLLSAPESQLSGSSAARSG